MISLRNVTLEERDREISSLRLALEAANMAETVAAARAASRARHSSRRVSQAVTEVREELVIAHEEERTRRVSLIQAQLPR